MSSADKGHDKEREFDEYARREYGWVPIHSEHRYRRGPVFRTCNVAGFDRLYLNPRGQRPVLVEVTDASDASKRRNRINETLRAAPALLDNFIVVLAVYHGGQRRLDRRTRERRWTKAGTWDVTFMPEGVIPLGFEYKPRGYHRRPEGGT